MQDLRDNIDVKKWEINQAAGRYIRSHEEVQHISIRNRLHDFMRQHGAELAATLAPELMGYNEQLPCSGQLKLATALEFFQYRFSDSFGGNPPL